MTNWKPSRRCYHLHVFASQFRANLRMQFGPTSQETARSHRAVPACLLSSPEWILHSSSTPRRIPPITKITSKKLTPQASHNPGPSALPSPPFVYNDRSPLPRRFPCTVPGCQARFTRKHHMTSHLITHTEGKPFHCTVGPYCKASFRRLQDLRRHVKTVRHDL
ncbi:hypothetical protein BC830DRAFT_1155059 [Chytriomyces sp. MP71]|nr:hypothetical protein BC830DRAFT_1155059 [Chytriomyces sp. MP71]